MLVIAGIILFLYISKPTEPPTMPKDFDIYYSFGVGEKNIFDTKNDLWIKDMVCDPSLNYTVALTQNEKKVIYEAIVKNDFFSLKENMLPSSGVSCEPSSGLTLQVTADEKTKTVRWMCGYSESNPDYLKLKSITNTIQNIISKKESEMSVPEPKCGYI